MTMTRSMRNGVSIGYIGSADLEVSSSTLQGRHVYAATGHDEYWSGHRRTAVEAAAAAGTHMLFLGEQHSYEKVRYRADLQGNSQRVLVVYKTETVSDGGYNGLDDPLKNDPEWTGLWRDTRTNQGWVTPRAMPENSLTGVLAGAGAGFADPDRSPRLTVPLAMTKLRAWRNTSCSTATQPCVVGIGNAGFEMDVRADRYYEAHVGTQPPGLFSISASIANTGLIPTPGVCPPGVPAASTLQLGIKAFEDKADCSLSSLTIEATLHRKPSHALVFASAAFRWPWALDAFRNSGFDNQPGAVSPEVQQNLINLLADMNVQPGSRMTDTCVAGAQIATPGCLIAATASTDTTPPVSTITNLNTSTGLVLGTVSDVGGVVAGVEVSVDSGATWHGAVLTGAAPSTTWSYMTVSPAGVNLQVRAVDDSGNLEVAHGASPAIPASDGLGVWAFANASPVGTFSTLPPVTGATGWTSVVPVNVNGDSYTDLLFYNRANGATIYTVGTGNSGNPQAIAWSCTAGVNCSGTGWTAVVPMNINNDAVQDYLSYNVATGQGVFSVGVSNPWTQSILATTGGPFEPIGDTRPPAPGLPPDPTAGNHQRVGWTTIVPMNLNGDNLTDLLSYNSATGLAVYSVGVLPGGSSYPQQIVAIVNAAPGWTSIVPMTITHASGPYYGLTDLLSYNAATGVAVYSTGVPVGTAGYPQRIEAITTVEPGWTTIAPMKFNSDTFTDLFWFNAATGNGKSTVAAASGVPQQLAAQNLFGATWWTSIVPLNLNGDGLTDALFVR